MASTRVLRPRNSLGPGQGIATVAEPGQSRAEEPSSFGAVTRPTRPLPTWRGYGNESPPDPQAVRQHAGRRQRRGSHVHVTRTAGEPAARRAEGSRGPGRGRRGRARRQDGREPDWRGEGWGWERTTTLRALWRHGPKSTGAWRGRGGEGSPRRLAGRRPPLGVPHALHFPCPVLGEGLGRPGGPLSPLLPMTAAHKRPRRLIRYPR